MSDHKLPKTPSKIVHLLPRERMALCTYLLTAVDPKNRAEQRRYDRTFTECDLTPFEVVIPRLLQVVALCEQGYAAWHEVARKAVEKLEKPFDTVPTRFPLGNDTVDYLLEVTDRQIKGELSRILFPVSERLLAAKEGTYELPEELQDAEMPAPSNGHSEAPVATVGA